MARQQRDRRQELTLEKAVMHLLEECRMVLPGIQMTFGFQLIVVFNSTFRQLLDPAQQRLHLVAITAVALAAALVMAPAAFHREIAPMEVSDRLVRLTARLLWASMFPLAIGLCIDLYLLATVVLRNSWGLPYAVVLFLALISLWYLLPLASRLTRGPRPSRIPPAEEGE
jgi:hypothetical protein